MTEQPAVPVRHTVDTITSDALDELYERLRKAERAANLLADSHRRAEAAEARLQVTSEAAGTVLDRTATERDDARQQAAAIAAQRDRLRQRMYTLARRSPRPDTRPGALPRAATRPAPTPTGSRAGPRTQQPSDEATVAPGASVPGRRVAADASTTPP